MVLIDTRQQATDEVGDILAGGQYRFFKYKTNTPVSWFADSDYITDMGVAMQLDGAGWPPMTAYFQEDITVHSFKYLGMDEYGAEMYAPVKVWDEVQGSDGSESGATVFLNTITDLREYEADDNTSVIVLGYHTKGDMPPVIYTYSASAIGLDNGGNIIASAIMSTGRWLCTYGEQIDCRNFGVVAGISSINSYLANAVQYCNNNSRILVFVSGTYNLYGSGSLTMSCPWRADKFVRINVTSGSYTLNSTNEKIEIGNTFCGTGLKLILNGVNYENTTIPITAWNTTDKGYDLGTAQFNLLLNNATTVYMWNASKAYNNIICDQGWQSIDINAFNVTAVGLEGKGKLRYSNNSCITFKNIHTSMVNIPSYQMVKTTDVIYLDSAVTLHSAAEITAYVEASGAGSLDTSDVCKMTGGYGGKSNFILTAHGLDVGYHTVKQDYFNSPVGLVNTWNNSYGATGILDLGQAVSTATVTRGGIVYNGTIGGVGPVDITLDRCNVTGDIASTYVSANNCVINGQLYNLTGSQFKNVQLTNTAMVNVSNAVWEEVNCAGTIYSIGGGFRLRDVFAAGGWFIPNNNKQFSNASWIGGSASSINFDASTMGVEGEAVAFNVVVKNIVYLPSGIYSSNGTTKKWAVNGHYNIQICDNEGQNTKKTEGILFALLKFRYNQLNSNSTLAGWVIGVDSTGIFQFSKGSNATPLQIHYVCADKAADLPNPLTQYNFFPANAYKPYPSWHIQPSAQMTGDYMLMRFFVGAGAKTYTGGSDGTGNPVFADPGVVNANHYFVNFKIYP